MITDSEKNIILKYARKYDVSEVYLFGSAIEKKANYNDIDIGVNGIRPNLFFAFYGDLFKDLPKPVDLIDLSDKSLFTSKENKSILELANNLPIICKEFLSSIKRFEQE